MFRVSKKAKKRLRLGLAVIGVLVAASVAIFGFKAAQENRQPPVASQTVQDYYERSRQNFLSTATPIPGETSIGPVAAFLGDSYTVGARASSESNRWSTLASQRLGWVEVNFGIADSGYLVAGSMPNGAPYADRIGGLTEAAPDIVVVSGGINDLYSPSAELSAAIDRTYIQLREQMPDAQIYGVSPFWGSSEAIPEQMALIARQVKASVEAVGGQYIDVGYPILGHAEWMHEDKVHPLDQGYRALADTFADALD